MTRLIAILSLVLAATSATAENPSAPDLWAAANFGQTWDPVVFDAARTEGITALRDEIHWDFAETDGRFDFHHIILTYPDLMAADGMRLNLIAAGGHPDHDANVTPHTPAAVAAFAAFFAKVAARFPAIEAVEVGNEMNSESFTSGPAREADIIGRAGYYAAILKAAHDAVRTARPQVRIIGGAAHSIPLAWFNALSEAGVTGYMDTVALHPYTTPPEQFRRQVALMREVPGFEDMPIEITEIGTVEATEAPGLLAKTYCQGALAGATNVTWYPLSPRGDGFVPLLEADGSVTDVGRTWQMIERELSGLPVSDVSPDPFTYACLFGDRALMIWGAARDLTLDDPALSVVDAAGRPVASPRLSNAAPLVVLSGGPAPLLGDNVHLGSQRVVADSFDQFAYPGKAGDGFVRFARVDGEAVNFVLGPGQQTGGVPWTPYLTTERDGSLRMDAGFLMPSMWGDAPAEIVHAFTAPEAMNVNIEAHIAPTPETSDGVVFSLRRNDVPLVEKVVNGSTMLTHSGVDLAQGDVLEIVLGPGDEAHGDPSAYRFTLHLAK